MKHSFENVSCPVCHTAASAPFCRVPDRFELEKGDQYRLLSCKGCRLIYLNPRPQEEHSGAFYQNSEYSPFISVNPKPTFFDKIYLGLRTWNNRWKRRKIEAVRSEPGKLLDVGCGTGEFMLEMKQAGWDIRGVERDGNAAACAIENHKLRIVKGTIHDLPAVNKTYDVITMWHVLEHIYDVHQTVQRVRDLLKPGGLFVVAVPNAASLDASIYRQNWIAWDSPRHVQHFSFETLSTLMKMHSMTLKKSLHLPLDTCFNTLMSEDLIRKRSGSKFIVMKIFSLMRAVFVAALTLKMGFFGRPFGWKRGSTLIGIWKK